MKVSGRNYDLSGIESGRLVKSRLVARLVPFWRVGAGPSWKYLFLIMLRHYFGYPIAYITERYSRTWQRVLRTSRRLAAERNRGRDTSR